MPNGSENITVKHITSTEVPSCQPMDTAAAVLEELVEWTWESADSIYVLDDGRLVGRINIVDLLGTSANTPASRLMEPAEARLGPDDKRERAIYLAIEIDRDEIPVVEAGGGLIGAVTSQAIIDTMHREHLEDVLVRAGIRKTGFRISDFGSASVRDAVRSRTPWLMFGLVVGLLLSVISSLFEATLQETVALAFFLPVIAYIADSVGTQSEAIAVRAFAIADVDFGHYLLREFLVGLVVGTLIGVLGGLGATVLVNSPQVGVVVGLSLLVSSAVATLLASVIPIGFIHLGVDPALGSGPLATAVQDIISIVIYFFFALSLL